MKRRLSKLGRTSAFVWVLTICLLSFAGDNAAPVKAKSPLSADATALYKVVLQRFAEGETGTLNVASTSYPLGGEDKIGHLPEDSDCLHGLHMENLAEAAQTVHDLPPTILPGPKLRLARPGKSVPSPGLLSLSEIVFDKEHRYAVVGYSFVCRGKCGGGRTRVYEKVGGEWKDANRECGYWITQLGSGEGSRNGREREVESP